MFKKFLLLTSSGLLKITLFVLALTAATWMVFGSSEGPKKALEDSGLYESVVDNALKSTQEAAQKEGSDFPLDDPAIQAAVKDALPPEFIQNNSEAFIDGLYGWLSGKTEQPQFAVDLTKAKQKLIDGVAAAAQKRYEGLPVCTVEQLRTLEADIDPFNAPCQPPGLASTAVQDKVRAELSGSKEFLNDTVLTAADLPKDDQGKTVTDNLAAAPDAYGLARSLPLLLAFVSVLLAAAVVFLSDTKLRGLRSVGITLLGTGIFLFIGSFLITYVFNQANKPGKLVQEGNDFNANIIAGLQSLSDSFNGALMRYYVAYILLGGGILLGLWFKNRNQKHQASPAVDDKAAVTEKPEEKPEPITDKKIENEPKADK
jgi:hypothetical protein